MRSNSLIFDLRTKFDGFGSFLQTSQIQKFQTCFSKSQLHFLIWIDSIIFEANDKLCQIDYFTYTTREMTALLKPLKSKSLKFKLIETGLLPPCAISIRLMRNGSIGGIDRPVWPFGYFWTISVITFGKQTVSPTLHCGISAAITTTSK